MADQTEIREAPRLSLPGVKRGPYCKEMPPKVGPSGFRNHIKYGSKKAPDRKGSRQFGITLPRQTSQILIGRARAQDKSLSLVILEIIERSLKRVEK